MKKPHPETLAIIARRGNARPCFTRRVIWITWPKYLSGSPARTRKLASAWPKLDAWIVAQGRTPGPSLWETYLIDPASNPDPSAWRTELTRPLAK